MRDRERERERERLHDLMCGTMSTSSLCSEHRIAQTRCSIARSAGGIFGGGKGRGLPRPIIARMLADTPADSCRVGGRPELRLLHAGR